MDDALHIIGLRAENIKRLRAVEIRPDPNLVIVGGRNGQGKTSLLDSIWFALGGKAAQADTPHPIRDGESEASVQLDLGQLTIERTWRGAASSLTVRSRDGSKVMSPQAVLDALTGEMAFDPLAFAGLSPKLQRETLLGLVELPFDLDQLDADRKAAYDERTDVNRRARALDARIEATPTITIPTGVPTINEAIAARQEAGATLQHNRDTRAAYHRATEAVAEAEQRVRVARAALAVLLEQQHEIEEDFLVRQEAFDSLGDDPDLDAFDQWIEQAEHWSQMRAQAARQEDDRNELADLERRVRELGTFMDALDETKRQGLAQAVMPVEGLSFGEEGGITYNDVPFSQASSAEKLRVATAIAMAGDPRIRVVVINNASLLDDDNRALIEEMAMEHDFQCWLEVVGDVPGAVIIEDGEVLG
jgi:hypothetical protein